MPLIIPTSSSEPGPSYILIRPRSPVPLSSSLKLLSPMSTSPQKTLSALSLLRPETTRRSSTPAGSHQRAQEDDHIFDSDHSERSTPTLTPSPATGFPNRTDDEGGSTDGDSVLTGKHSLSRLRENPSERSPLLRKASSPQYMTTLPSWSINTIFSKRLSMYSLRDISRTALRALPAVVLGCLLNILDGVSCAFKRPSSPDSTEKGFFLQMASSSFLLPGFFLD